jgi:hypothetical protein
VAVEVVLPEVTEEVEAIEVEQEDLQQVINNADLVLIADIKIKLVFSIIRPLLNQSLLNNHNQS